MTTWEADVLRRVAETDDLHISPLREDGETYGTPTWIWSAAVDGALYVRAYNGQASRWYHSRLEKKVWKDANTASVGTRTVIGGSRLEFRLRARPFRRFDCPEGGEPWAMA